MQTPVRPRVRAGVIGWPAPTASSAVPCLPAIPAMTDGFDAVIVLLGRRTGVVFCSNRAILVKMNDAKADGADGGLGAVLNFQF